MDQSACEMGKSAWSRQHLSDVFMQHREHLREMIRLRLDPRLHSRVDESDVVQEVFLRANQNLESYAAQQEVPPLVWLRQICKNLVAETHRHHFRSKRNPRLECQFTSEESDLLENFLAQSVESLGAKLAKVELLEQVRRLLRELTLHDREIIELKHIDGFSFQQAADALQLPLETVKKRYYRALERFQDLAKILSESRIGI